MITSTLQPFVPLVAALLGAVAVAIANYTIQRWRYLNDSRDRIVNELCREISNAADLGVDYWLLDASQIDQDAKARLLEPRLKGFELLIIQLVETLEACRPKKTVSKKCRSALTDFFDALTGGNFEVRNRSADPVAASKGMAAAAELIGSLRMHYTSRGLL